MLVMALPSCRLCEAVAGSEVSVIVGSVIKQAEDTDPVAWSTSNVAPDPQLVFVIAVLASLRDVNKDE
jgi:hypothetical protein